MVRILEKRFCSSLTGDAAAGEARGGGGLGEDGVAGLVRPIPSPGTEMPAAPSLLTAPWFNKLLLLPPVLRGVRTGAGLPELVLGGSRGGNLGGAGLDSAPTAES